jgi:L-malate glycosyltransferase
MSEKIRLLQVFPFYIPATASNSSGVKSSTLTLIAGLDQNKYAIYVLLPAPSPHDRDFLKAGADGLLYLDDPEHLVFELARASPAYALHSAWRFYRNFRRSLRLLKCHSIGLVHTQASGYLATALAARVLGIPSIVHIREFGFRLPGLIDRMYRLTLKKVANHIICCANFIRRSLMESGIDPAMISTIYNAVDIERFSRHSNNLRAELSIPECRKVIGAIGRISPRKGFDYFIAAAELVLASHPECTFILVGEADEPYEQEHKAALYELSKDLRARGEFIFLGARNDIVSVMNTFDILVFSSPNDIGPRVPIEAMAACTPVVSASYGGAQEEIVDMETGFLVPPRDVQAIAQALLALLQDDNLRKKMGLAGRKRVQQLYTRERYVSMIEDLYDEFT